MCVQLAADEGNGCRRCARVTSDAVDGCGVRVWCFLASGASVSGVCCGISMSSMSIFGRWWHARTLKPCAHARPFAVVVQRITECIKDPAVVVEFHMDHTVAVKG